MLNWSLCYLSYVYIIFVWVDATWVWVPAETEESSWSRGSEEKAAASHPTCAGNWAWVFCRSHKHSWLLIRLSPWTGYKCLLCLGGTVAFGFQFSLFSVEHLLTHTHFVFSKSPSLLLLMLLLGLQIALLRIQGCSVLCGCCGVMSAPIPRLWMLWCNVCPHPVAYVTEHLVPSWWCCGGRIWNLRNGVPARRGESHLGMGWEEVLKLRAWLFSASWSWRGEQATSARSCHHEAVCHHDFPPLWVESPKPWINKNPTSLKLLLLNCFLPDTLSKQWEWYPVWQMLDFLML